MTGNKIFLHLSDLHFGDENETNSAKRTNTLNKLLLTLKKLPTAWKPQSIAISGDIGWKGLENDYNIAEAWLTELLTTLNLPADAIIPAPGNHDINLKIAASIAVPAGHIKADKLLDLDLLGSISVPFKSYEDFCKKMNISPLTMGSKSSYLAGSRVQNGITWLVLNSSWFCREGRKEKLHMGLPHLEVVTAEESWERRDIPTIGILHHPPPCLQDEELNSYGSRRNTYDFLAGECHMILSGHVHGMLKAPDTMYQKSYLFTGGSSYSDEKVRNNFSIFRLDISSGKIEQRAYEWNPADGEWEHREKYSQVFPFIGEKKPGLAIEEEQDLHRRLFTCSRRHYEDLCGENGRFRHLDISDIILQKPSKKEWLDSPIKSFAGSRGGFSKEPLAAGGTLLDIIPLLGQEACKHAVVKGDGGMGKTVSLVRLWDEFTKHYYADRPVPVFIQLNEINTVPEEKRMDFILSTISRDYFDGRVSEEEILQFLRESRDAPAVVLLLDGFNEVTVENKELLIQLRKLMEQARGVQVVITSRYDMRETYGWEHLHLLELRGLEETQVREYLEKKNSKMPGGRLWELLRNPMMLTLYTSTCEVQGKYEGDFKERVETAGELLWNFMEAQVAVLLERLNYDKKTWWFYKFLLKFMLPAMGYEMEKVGLFAFDRETLYGVLDTYCSRFSREDFFGTFAGYDEYEDALPTGVCGDDKDRRKKRNEIVKILCNVLLMLVKEGKTFRFLHQDFRDYFAALHILQEAEMGVKRGELADVLKQRTLPVYIRHFMGEIEGEHYQKPVFQAGKGWLQEIERSSLFNRVLDLCRGVFDGSVGFGPWNIVETWKDFRGDLSSTDLSNLDLSKVLFQGIKCGRFFKNKCLGTLFDGSLITEESFLPIRHIGSIKSVALSKDGESFLSCSQNLVAEWNIETGRCITKFSGHSKNVNSVSYSPDEQKVLTASADSTIKEWERVSAKCLMTFEGHSEEVHQAIYSDNGKRILSASRDKTIREWNSETGECEKIFIGHSFEVIGAVYAYNGKMIISRSSDKTFRIWDHTSGKCLFTSPVFPERFGEVFFDEKENQIVCALHTAKENLFKLNWERNTYRSFDISNFFCIDFDIKRRKAAAGYYGGYIKEWDLDTGKCSKPLRGQSDTISSIKYSEDGSRIISGNVDGTIEYWDARNGHLLKTYMGRKIMIESAVFSNDGRRLLISSADGLIKEWDLDQGKFSKFFFGHLGSVQSAIYSMDGKRLLSTSSDNTIKEWDLETGECLKTFNGHSNSVNSAVYSADGTKVLSASSDKTIREWDWKTGKCITVFKGHSLAVNSAVYSSNGMKILSTSCDNGHPIKEWCIKTGDCLKTYKGHKRIVKKARYINDDRKILSMSFDGTLKEWCVKDGKCLNSSTIGWFDPYYPFVEELPHGITIKPISAYQVVVSEISRNLYQRIENVPQLNLLGCSFKNLHPDSDLSEESKNLMRQYGAVMDE